MTAITDEMVHTAYAAAKQVWAGHLGRTVARSEVTERTGMGIGSAGDYISAFLAMMEGRKYTRTINLYATEYYLIHIGEDYGPEAQKKAALAVKAHVDYYRQVHAYLAKTDQLADRFLQ